MKTKKANQNTHYPGPYKAGSIVNIEDPNPFGNQSSVISPEICSPGPRHPDNLIPWSPLVSPPSVFCLLPMLPILPVLPHPYFLCVLPVPCVFPPSVPLFLCAFVATSQLCKTNPIPKTQKSAQPLMPEGVTAILLVPNAQKNKPNQTQLVAAKPARGGAKPEQSQFSPLRNQLTAFCSQSILPALPRIHLSGPDCFDEGRADD